MPNIKKTLPSGAHIEIQTADFEKSFALLQAVKKSMLNVEDLVGLSTSEMVQSPLWDCMAVCTYNGIRITKETFDPEPARPDYLLVAQEVLIKNLRPFFQSLASESTKSTASGPLDGQK
jgi:hypothetical protein